ncbi:D-serine/D-alanine/glycine transporter [Kluyvera cryocrescens]|uniref:D-serine/D-alanine/glycine transporter n=1 Tax=Kluyvera cryocrescens TaxID=580 RepID=A0A485BBL4_KLUCR|nr:D-serine/D-alanine/glycine transporter [Kluyvera cryocrescens]
MLVGLPAAASIINFVVLTSATSSANSGVFSTSRMLFGLAQDGVAPSLFAKLSKRAVPAKGLTFLLHLPAGWRSDADGEPKRNCRVYHDHHRIGDSVHVRLDDYPVLLPGLP